MVQVIEQEDYGERLSKALGGGASSALSLLINAKMKGMQEQKKAESLATLLGDRSFPQEEIEKEEVSYSPGQLIAAEQLYPGAGKILQQHEKTQAGKAEKAAEKKRLQSSINNMFKVLPKVGPGKALNRLTEEGRKARQYFDSLAMNLEEIAATMVGKGTLSKPRFQFLLKNLPSSSKTQAANQGALQAWSETLGVEFPGVQIEEETEIEGPANKELTKSIAMEFLRKAKGDKDKARKLAKKYGYTF